MRLDPLSFHNIIRVSTSPRVCTFHVTPEYQRDYPNDPLPVVLGSINRYVLDKPRVLTCAPSGKIGEGITEILESVNPLGSITLCKQVLVSLSTRGGPMRFEDLSKHKDAIKETTIEVYGIVKFVMLSETEMIKQEAESRALANSKIPDRNKAFAQRPAASLMPLQVMFDDIDQFAGPWKGRIKLKNMEDCPPCTACDLDCQEQWRRTVKNGKYYVPG